jgi:hypothetical protein
MVLIQKKQKIKSLEMLLCCTRASTLQIRQNLGWELLLPLCFAPSQPYCKNSLCPAIAHKAAIVLPDFAQSCSADGEEKK